MLGVFRSSFGQRQQKREHRDHKRDRLIFFLGLDCGIGGFRHQTFPSSAENARALFKRRQISTLRYFTHNSMVISAGAAGFSP